MRQKRFSCFAPGLLAGALGLCSIARAEQPDAGQVLERSREPLTVTPLQAPQIETPAAPPPPAPETATLKVTHIRLTGMTLFPEQKLHALVAHAEGRLLSLTDLQTLTALITRYYRDQGYLLARAFLPPQEVQAGVVEIAVQEGRLEAVSSEDHAGLSASLRRRLDAGLALEQPLRTADLERAVLLNDALPGIAAHVRLRPGERPGGTVVVMETRQEKTLGGELTLDNYGDRYTGRNQAGLRLEWDNPAGHGDQLALRTQAADSGRLYGQLGYDFSVSGPLRATLSYSRTRYELGKEFAALVADGWADTASLEMRYPSVLRAALRLSPFLAADHMRLVDRIGLTDSKHDKDLTAGRMGLVMQAADSEDGQSALTLQLTAGRLNIHDAAEQALDQATLRSEGGFNKVTLMGERWQNLPAAFQLRLRGNLQWAFNNLASVQKLGIAGPYGVRAYPIGEAQGDDAQLASLEIRHALAVTPEATTLRQLTVLVFADYGHVRLNHQTWPGFSGINSRELSAAGLGLDWNGPWGLDVSARQAWRGPEPVMSEPDSKQRFWLAASLKF